MTAVRFSNWFTAVETPRRRDNGDGARNRRQTARERALAAGWPRWAAEVEAAVAW